MHACRWRAPNLHEFIVLGRGLADERGRPCFPYRRQLARLLFLKLAALIRGALLCGSSFAHRDMTVALRGLNDDRDIVTKSCKDHDQPRFRVPVDVAAPVARLVVVVRYVAVRSAWGQ
jgi:hypothetical protein